MPRPIIGAAFVSLDGIIQAPGAPEEDRSGGFAHGGWLAPHMDEALGDKIAGLFEAPFELLLGRRTYDIFAAYWPFMPADDPIAAAFGQVAKHVVTRSHAPLGWGGSRAVHDIAAIAELKQQDGPRLVIQGSSTLYPPLLAAGLLDRIELMIAPVVLGSGKRLFDGPAAAAGLQLAAHRVTSRGVILADYVPAGAVPAGSFEAIAPSAPELARRRKIHEGTW